MRTLALYYLLLLVLPLAACESKKVDKAPSTKEAACAGAELALKGCKAGGGSPADDEDEIDLDTPETDPKDDAPQLTNAEVKEFLLAACGSCHGEDADGNRGANFAAFPLTEELATQRGLESSIFAPIAYAAIYNKLSEQATSTPSPMPPDEMADEDRSKLRGVLGWFNLNLPLAVAEAEQTYGIKGDSTADSKVLQFTCSNPVSTRIFLNRMTYALFDRPPEADEMAWYNEEQLGEAVSRKRRAAIVRKLRGEDWKSEFMAVGLKKLAQSISGATAIKASDYVTPAIADDAKVEFYLLMSKYFGEWDYGSYFSENKVMVSERTASAYGCEGKANEFIECAPKAPRDGFFTTLGFLTSKPSSFLRENNNYGRVAALYFSLYGQGFSAAFNGPAGGETKPLPKCLETADTRLKNDAPRGSAAIPSFGNFCQSCHISRNMAAGSVLFRPYSMNGTVLTTDNLATVEPKDLADATSVNWKKTAAPGDKPDTGVQVDTSFLQGLLSAKPKACAVATNDQAEDQEFAKVSDLSGFLMTNERALVRGFIRHAHRAFASSQSVNFDLVYGAIKSYEAGKKKLPDLLEVYFSSETFACDRRN